MANLLSIAGFSGTNGSHFELRLEYDLTQSVSGNYTDITYYLKMTSKDGYSGSGATSNGYINNSQVGSFNSIGVNTTIDIGQRTVREYHNSEGKKTASFSASINTPWALGNANTSGTFDLPKITRQAELTKAVDFNDEQNPTIEFVNTAGYRINARLEFSGGTIRRDNIPNTGSYTFELTNEERNLLRSRTPNSNALKVRETIATCYEGTTEGAWSYVDKKMTIVNANPIFTNFEFEDVNETTLALTGDSSININNYSNIQATISTSNKAEAIKSATMNKYRFKIGDSSVDIPYSSDSNVNGTINGATTGVYEVWAIDSRGNSTLATKQATSIINYDKVYIDKQSCSFVRDSNQVGENAILTLRGTFWNNNFGQVNNSLSVSYRLKKTTSSIWITGTTTITPTISENDFTFIGQIASDNVDTTWDLEDNYNLEITVSDELSSITYDELVLNSAIPTLCLDKNGVGVMCAYDSNLGGKLQVDGKNVAYEGFELYDNTSGSTGSITLNDDVENYSYIEIFYRNNNSLYGYSKFYSPSGKNLTLSIMYPDSSSNQIWIQSTTKTITGKNMTNVSERYAEAEVYAKAGFGRNDRIYITRIVGYKS